jgi:hypothetical protein
VDALAHHALLAVAVAALAGASVRLASTLAPRGLERAVAAAPIGVSAAVLWALALGLAGLGTDPAALGASAAATWLAVRLTVPAPAVPLAVDAGEWWAGLSLPARVAAGALAGAAAAWAGFVLRHPQLGTDAVVYHLPDVVGWIGNGRPGSVIDVYYALPFGNYPQATEVAMAWGAGLSRSFVFPALWSLGTLLLLAGAGWLGLRSLGADRRVTALGLAAVCTAPLVAHAAGTVGTDLPALAWLVAAAALVAASRARPGLLAPALLAAALGIGTKTTVAPLALLVLGLGWWTHRSRLGQIRRPLLAAGAAAAVVGGAWYVRNAIGHGSPLWPLVEIPGSDPLPDLVERSSYSVLDRPHETLAGNLDVYERRLAGYLLLIAAAVVAPLLARRRAVIVAGAATGLSLLLWLNAPFTGAGDLGIEGPFLSAVRYLLPAAAAGAACLVLAAAQGPRPARVLAIAALGLATAWNLLRTSEIGYPITPSAATLLGAAAVGAALAAALARLRLGRRAVQAAAALAAIVAVGAGAAATDGYVERYVRANQPYPRIPYTDVVGLLAARPDFRDGSEPVYMAPGVSAMLAGDTFDHEVELIPREEPCARVEARARTGWVVIGDLVAPGVPPYTARQCFHGRRPVVELEGYRVFRDAPPARARPARAARAAPGPPSRRRAARRRGPRP